jgi:glutaredoxin
MTGGLRETGGERKGVIQVVTFTLEGCGACMELKKELGENGVPFTNITIDDRLGDILEKEYMTEHYPIVVILEKNTKIPYWIFVTESFLEDPKVIHWQTGKELIIKIKNKYNALQTTSF